MGKKKEEKKKNGTYYSLKKFFKTECSKEFSVSDLVNSVGRNKNPEFLDLRECSNSRIYDLLNLMIRQGFLESAFTNTAHPKKLPTRIFTIKYKQLNNK